MAISGRSTSLRHREAVRANETNETSLRRSKLPGPDGHRSRPSLSVRPSVSDPSDPVAWTRSDPEDDPREKDLRGEDRVDGGREDVEHRRDGDIGW